jgi:hypothetical protein
MTESRGRAMVIVEMMDGSIQLVRTEAGPVTAHGCKVMVFDEDVDRANVKRIVGNYFHYPDWVKLTPEQEAECKAWTGGESEL